MAPAASVSRTFRQATAALAWVGPLLVLVVAVQARPNSFTWSQPSGGPWANASNWGGFGYPQFLSEVANFNLDATYTVTDDASRDFGRMHISRGNVTLNPGGDMSVQGSNGISLWVGGTETQAGSASLTISGVSLRGSANAYIGGFNQPSSRGTLTIGTTGGANGEYTSTRVYVGHAGQGSVYHRKGVHFGNTIILGSESTGVGTYAISAGALECASLLVGGSGQGTFIHDGGRVMVGDPGWTPGTLTIGRAGTYTLRGSGTLNVSDWLTIDGGGRFQLQSGSIAAGLEIINYYGDSESPSQLVQNGGVNSANTIVLVDPGQYLLNGGTCTSNRTDLASGRWTQNDGWHSTAHLTIGTPYGVSMNRGTYTLAGGMLQVSGSVELGGSGRGEFIQTGGQHNAATLTVGAPIHFAANAGTYTMSGGTLSTSSTYLGGELGFGTFIQSGGRHTASRLQLRAHPEINGTSAYVMSGGTCATAQTVLTHGKWVQSGGLHSTPDLQVLGTMTSTGPTSYSISGGTLQAALAVNYSEFTQTGGTVDAGNFVGTTSFGDMGTLVVNGGEFRADRIRQGFVSIGGSGPGAGRVVIKPGGSADNGASRLRPVHADAGTLDITDNSLVVPYPDQYTIGQLVRAARNDGEWDRPGITSSTARDNPVHSTTIGVISGAQFKGFHGATATFGGLTLADTDALLKYTYHGDTDLNGIVDFDDYVRLDHGFNTASFGWAKGDFDYDGWIGFDDYVLIDLGFNAQNGTLRAAQAFASGEDRSMSGAELEPGVLRVKQHIEQFGAGYATAFVAAVPEPAGAGVVVLATLVGLCGRTRRTLSTC